MKPLDDLTFWKRFSALAFAIALLAVWALLSKDEPKAALIVEEKREQAQPALQLPLAYDFYMRQATPGEEPRHTYYTRPENR